MDVQVIECKKIEFPKANSEFRSFNREFATNLAVSLKAEGLFNAIAVRPNPAKPGFYIGVQGKHRYYAAFNVLKWEGIDCNVLEEMDDEEAQHASITENLWRNPLTKKQHLMALRRWWSHFSAKHPERATTGGPGGLARAAAQRAAKCAQIHATAASGTGEMKINLAHAHQAEDQDAQTNGFASLVAATTGQSKSAAKRDVRIARCFDEEALEVFAQTATPKGDILTISKVKDAMKRREIVSLIASGMDAPEAIREVMKDAAPTHYDPKTEAARETHRDRVPELSDDEWFATYCGDKARLFKHPEKFKADALLYRHTTDARHTFRVKSKKFVAAAKQGSVSGPFVSLVNRLISASHPKDWFLCEVCRGSGEMDGSATAKCQKCYGACYQIKTENYL